MTKKQHVHMHGAKDRNIETFKNLEKGVDTTLLLLPRRKQRATQQRARLGDVVGQVAALNPTYRDGLKQ